MQIARRYMELFTDKTGPLSDVVFPLFLLPSLKLIAAAKNINICTMTFILVGCTGFILHLCKVGFRMKYVIVC